jgi:hypothetical protein
MEKTEKASKHGADRRSFLKKGMAAAGAATVGAGLLLNGNSTLAEEASGHLDARDASILRFLAAAEILETDLWQQYNELGGIQDKEVPGNPAEWFATKSVFVSPCVAAVPPAKLPTCHPGTLGRNALTGPGFVNTDFSVTKNTKINERFNLQFRAELFDVFNHPNFGNPVLTTTSSAFGVIQSTRFPTGDFGSSRQVQFALKVQF